MSTGCDAPISIEVRIRGHLDQHWSAWFGDLALTHHADGTTTLRGTVTDQAQLFGVLAQIRDLIALIALTPLDPPRGSAPEEGERKLATTRSARRPALSPGDHLTSLTPAAQRRPGRAAVTDPWLRPGRGRRRCAGRRDRPAARWLTHPGVAYSMCR